MLVKLSRSKRVHTLTHIYTKQIKTANVLAVLFLFRVEYFSEHMSLEKSRSLNMQTPFWCEGNWVSLNFAYFRATFLAQGVISKGTSFVDVVWVLFSLQRL